MESTDLTGVRILQLLDPNEYKNDPGNSQTTISELYHRYAPALLLYLRNHTSSLEDAEDLLLETFTAALIHKQLQAMPEFAQRLWLWRVARNKLVDAYRQQGRRFTTSLEEAMVEILISHDPTPDYLVLRQEEDAYLHMAIRQLSPLQQQVLRLRFVQNLRCKQIAPMVGKSEKAIRSLLARTLNNLRSLYVIGQEN